MSEVLQGLLSVCDFTVLFFIVVGVFVGIVSVLFQDLQPQWLL